ncbi:MAG: hypothetical protein H0U00_06900 [Actinobacteria bacterium]|nr:hypothetical protein [Actinomycetota bacterium]
MSDRDLYSRHPHRLREALERGEMTFTGFGIASFLIDRLDDGRSENVAYTLAALADAVGWEIGTEQLRRELHRLRDDDWVDFEVRTGQRKPWIFTLKRAALGGHEPPDEYDLHSTSTSPPPERPLPSGGEVEVTSTGLRSSAPANPLWATDSAPSQPPPGGGPIDVDETETEKTDWRAVAAGAAPAPPESIDEIDFDSFDDDVLDDEADTEVEILIQLIDDLGGRDGRTGATLRREAAELSAREIAYVAGQVRKRDYIESPGAYAVAVIQNIRAGYSGP